MNNLLLKHLRDEAKEILRSIFYSQLSIIWFFLKEHATENQSFEHQIGLKCPSKESVTLFEQEGYRVVQRQL